MCIFKNNYNIDKAKKAKNLLSIVCNRTIIGIVLGTMQEFQELLEYNIVSNDFF